MIYVGQPYHHPDLAIRNERYARASAFVADQLKLNPHQAIYAPIVHWHEVALMHRLPEEPEFWYAQNRAVLRRCTELWVLELPGWEESNGLKLEIQFAAFLGLPIKQIHFE